MEVLSNGRKAEIIFDLVRRSESEAITGVIQAAARHAVEQEGDKRWKQEEDRSFDRSPYNVLHTGSQLERAEITRKQWSDIVNFAFERFIKE